MAAPPLVRSRTSERPGQPTGFKYTVGSASALVSVLKEYYAFLLIYSEV